MSDQENKNGGTGKGGPSVVVLEQSATSRHKNPYCLTELQEKTSQDSHHKHSKAPAVPSVTEELRKSANPDPTALRECESAMSSENHKQTITKNYSSNIRKRESLPETLKMVELEIETKKETSMPSSQPIPAQPIDSVISNHMAQKAEAETKGDDDNITDDIAELRTPELPKRTSEWENEVEESGDKEVQENTELASIRSKIEKFNNLSTSSHVMKKKEVSWNEHKHLHNEKELGVRSQVLMLERKSSVGPCYRSGNPSGKPSGITICLPKKSVGTSNDVSKSQQSMINITVSKKCLLNKTTSGIDNQHKESPIEQKADSTPEDMLYVKFLSAIRGKIENMRGKIKNVLNM